MEATNYVFTYQKLIFRLHLSDRLLFLFLIASLVNPVRKIDPTTLVGNRDEHLLRLYQLTAKHKAML